MTEYVELELDTGNLASATGGVSEFDLGQQFQNVIGAKVIEANIPFIWEVIGDAYLPAQSTVYPFYENSIQLTTNYPGVIGDPFVTARIPKGTYTPSSLITALEKAINVDMQSQMTAEWGFTVTVDITFNPTTLHFLFTYTSSIPIGALYWLGFNSGLGIPPNTREGQNSMFRAIGVYGNGSSATLINNSVSTEESVFPVQTQGWTYLYLCSRTLGPNFRCYTTDSVYSGSKALDNYIIAKIPINCNYGQTIVWQDPDPQNYFTFHQVNTLKKLDVWLASPYQPQTPLYFNQNGFSFKLGLLLQPTTMGQTLPGTEKVGRARALIS